MIVVFLFIVTVLEVKSESMQKSTKKSIRGKAQKIKIALLFHSGRPK